MISVYLNWYNNDVSLNTCLSWGTFYTGKVANGIMIYTCLPFKQRKSYHDTWYKYHMIEGYLTYVTSIFNFCNLVMVLDWAGPG